MHVVCTDPDFRNWLSYQFNLVDVSIENITVSGSVNSVHSSFGTPDRADCVVVAVKDLNENNLKSSIRFMLVNAEKPIKLAIVAEEWNENNLERLEQVIRTEYRRAETNNQTAIQKTSSILDCKWKEDRLEQLQNWRTISTFQYSTFTKSNGLLEEVKKYFSDCLSGSILNEDDHFISQKAPILHWTATPLEGELQIVIRYSFPLYGPDGSLLRSLAADCRSLFDSTYEWTNGVLMTCDPIRVHAQLMTPTRLEVAARISSDELEGEDVIFPTRLLWPFLSVVVGKVQRLLDENRNIQFSTEIVLFGCSFFAPPIESRVFDLPSFMSTAIHFNKVAFEHDGIHEVQLRNVFTGSVPDSFLELCSQSLPSPRTEGIAPLQQDKMTPLFDSPSPSSLTVSHNRGRRVSFGTIRCIDGDPQTQPVEEYVDKMLQQTIETLIHSN